MARRTSASLGNDHSEALCRGTPQRRQRALTDLSMETAPGPSSFGIAAEIKATPADVGSKRILGQQHTVQETKEKKTSQSQTEEHRCKRACPLTARWSISKAMKGLVANPAAGTAEQRKHWTTGLILPKLKAKRTHHRRGTSSNSARSLERRQIQGCPKRHERTRTQQDKWCDAPA